MAPSRALLDELLGSRRDEVLEVARRHRGRSIAVFGSVARREERPGSDVDFLVDFEPQSSLSDLIHLQDELEALLGRPVDVVSRGGLKERDETIRREAVAI
jgi:uncharacterized protein